MVYEHCGRCGERVQEAEVREVWLLRLDLAALKALANKGMIQQELEILRLKATVRAGCLGGGRQQGCGTVIGDISTASASLAGRGRGG